MPITAQQIADAVLAEVEGEDLLIEAMARALCKVYQPRMDPDAVNDAWGEEMPYWKGWQMHAKAHLVCDRVLRGPGDQMAYERFKREV